MWQNFFWKTWFKIDIPRSKQQNLIKLTYTSETKNNTVCVCVCVCVCVYTLPSVGFFRLHDICDIRVRSLDQRSFVVSISECCCQVPLSLSMNLSYSTSKDENSSQPLTGEKSIWYNVWNPSRRWYILI